jgi:hypothetical protein
MSVSIIVVGLIRFDERGRILRVRVSAPVTPVLDDTNALRGWKRRGDRFHRPTSAEKEAWQTFQPASMNA